MSVAFGQPRPTELPRCMVLLGFAEFIGLQWSEIDGVGSIIEAEVGPNSTFSEVPYTFLE